MPTTRLDIEYDGTAFAGWAKQPGLRTVQGEMEGALARLRGGSHLDLTVAGRTDRGVHAWGQVASYRGEPVARRGFDALLPADIAVTAVTEAADGFDARHDARSRTYCFRILTRSQRSPFEARRALHWPYAFERAALHECAAVLPGTHDFTAFTPAETDHVRFERVVMGARWEERGDVLEFWIEADAFMRNMNRILVGTMLQVAAGRRTLESFAALLQGAPRTAAGPTAAPQGLYLASVRY